jgi:hypothetical protein
MNLKSTQSEFRWKDYGQHTISAQQNSKSAVRNSETYLLPVLFQFMPKIMDRNYWRLEREFVFWKWLFIRIKRFLHSFVPDISQHSEKLIPNKKKRRTPLEKKNSRTGREIEDLLGVFFLLLFSHVVLLFKYKSLCNLWHDLWLDTLLGV